MSEATIFAGKYEILETLGTGAMCDVFKAHHLVLGLPVALKVLKAALAASREGRERFINEARTSSRLRHPHIVQVYEVYQHDDRPYIAMEYVEGVSFRSLLAQNISLFRALEILIDVAEALAYAHQARVLHRDLKPDNILVSTEGVAKVADWGLSKGIGSISTLTRPGILLGTPDYMSPEQITSRSEALTAQSDLYSLGAMLFEAATGATPFAGKTTADILQAHLHQAPPRLEGIIPSLARLIDDLLAKDPSQRPASADEVVGQLKALAANVPLHADGKACARSQEAKGSRQRNTLPGTHATASSARARAHQTRVDIVAPADTVLSILDTLIAPIEALDDDGLQKLHHGLNRARSLVSRAFLSSDRHRLGTQAAKLVAQALKTVGLDQSELKRLSNCLTELFQTGVHPGSSLAKRLLPLRVLEVFATEREGFAAPWPSIAKGLGFTYAAGSELGHGDRETAIIATASLLQRIDDGHYCTYLATDELLSRLRTKPFHRGLTALAARNVILDAKEMLPPIERPLTVLGSSSTRWPPAEVSLLLALREFSRETALIVRINDHPEIVVLNAAYAQITKNDFYLCDPLVVSTKLPPDWVINGTNRILLKAVTLPVGQTFRGVALRKIALKARY